ncbi:MAG: sigma-54-dependent Fis family transcriptional regulator [Proteobacteria bacterium]|nr:sigma-54-dependent Fis family transcriptional regulator [Pseudomonadota bacterium]
MDEKRKILFVCSDSKFPLPSSRIKTSYYLYSNLTSANEWNKEENIKIKAIFIDVDAVAGTLSLDDWATKAWRNTFNELVVKCIGPDGEAPTLVAYTREATWDTATLAIKIGVRDLCKLSKIEERIQYYLALDSEDKIEINTAPIPITQGQEIRDNQPVKTIAPHTIPYPIEGLEGNSLAIESVRNLIRKCASLETSVLIEGDTGTGKDLVAKALHNYSRRAQGPFITVSCGAIAPNLIEAELFGHIKGAYTGADRERTGLIASANGGTLFLDDISSLAPDFQAKLLRVLQDKKIKPVGSSQEVSVDIRLISSSKENLSLLVEKGLFREDLLYRIKVMDIILPRLSERKSDIPLICGSALKKLARKNKRPLLELSSGTLEKLIFYSWPGNIRELENILEHAATLAWAENRKQIEVHDLPATMQSLENVSLQLLSLKDAVRQFEKDYISRTVKRLGGSKESAAETLGLSLATLYRKLG